jgi:ferric iron reductase protein FhuF
LAAAAALPALLDGLVGPLVGVVRAQVPVAERLLWGNAASAVAAAKRLLVVQRPEVACRAADVAAAVLARGSFAGAGELLPPREPDRVWTFRRRSCCLYYRVPASGGLCDDCVLVRRPG